MRKENILKDIINSKPEDEIEADEGHELLTVDGLINNPNHLFEGRRHCEIERNMGNRSMSTVSSYEDLIFAADCGAWQGLLRLKKPVLASEYPEISEVSEWNVFSDQVLKSSWNQQVIVLQSKNQIKVFRTLDVKGYIALQKEPQPILEWTAPSEMLFDLTVSEMEEKVTIASCDASAIYIWDNVLKQDSVPITESYKQPAQGQMSSVWIRLHSKGIYYAFRNRQLFNLDPTWSNHEEILAEDLGFNVECLAQCSGNAMLITCNKAKNHLQVFEVNLQGVVNIVDIPNQTLCYAASTSPCGRYLAIAAREGGVSYVGNGRLCTVYHTGGEKMAECPAFTSDSNFQFFSTYNPNKNIKKSLHFLKWRTGLEVYRKLSMPEFTPEIKEITSSQDGKFVAVMTLDKYVHVFDTETSERITSQPIEGAFMEWDWGLMRFSRDSKVLFVCKEKDSGKSTIIQLVYISDMRLGQISPRKIQDVSPWIVEVEIPIETKLIRLVKDYLDKNEIYVLYNKKGERVDIYNQNGDCVGKLDDGRAFAVSDDGQLVAVRSGKTVMFKFTADGPVIDRIETHNFPKWYEFFPDSRRIAVLFADQIAVYDVLTHQKVCEIKRKNSGAFSIVKIVDNNTLIFEDLNRVLCYCNIKEQRIVAESKPFTGEIGKSKGRVWSNAAEKVMMPDGQDILIYDDPFSKVIGLEEFFEKHPLTIQGDSNLYLTGVIGTVNYSLVSFSVVYERALELQDSQVLSRQVAPYNINALHYFTITKNLAGLKFCSQINVPFLKDMFGNTPFDYAVETHDPQIVTEICTGIINYPKMMQEEAMSMITFEKLLNSNSLNLAKLLKIAGTKVPHEIKFRNHIQCPKMYQIEHDKMRFDESGEPLYTSKIQQKLHVKQSVHLSECTPIVTKVLTNPSPNMYSFESLQALEYLETTDDYQLLSSKAVRVFIREKWDQGARRAYLYQLILYFIYFVTISIFMSFEDGITNQTLLMVSQIIAIILNTVFLFHELVQVVAEKGKYFSHTMNIFDLIRIFLVYFGAFLPTFADQSIAFQFLLTLMLWMRLILHLQVFDGIRTLLIMIIEVVLEGIPFLVVLVLAMLADVHVNYSLCTVADACEDKTINLLFVESYGLLFGQMDNYSELPFAIFMILVIFSFINVLVLLNLLIAIMSNAYDRVSNNQIAVEMKTLANFLHEFEEVGYVLKGQKVPVEYVHIFYTESTFNEIQDEEPQIEDAIEKISTLVTEKQDELAQIVKAIGAQQQQVKNILRKEFKLDEKAAQDAPAEEQKQFRFFNL